MRYQSRFQALIVNYTPTTKKSFDLGKVTHHILCGRPLVRFKQLNHKYFLSPFFIALDSCEFKERWCRMYQGRAVINQGTMVDCYRGSELP